MIAGSFEAFRMIKKMLPKAPEVVVEATDTMMIVESPHNYPDDANYTRTITFPGASAIKITFDGYSSTEGCDILRFCRGPASDHFEGIACVEEDVVEGAPYVENPERCGREDDCVKNWDTIVCHGDTVCYQFTSDGSVTDWGYRFTAEAFDAEGWTFSSNGWGLPPPIHKDSETQYTVNSPHPYLDYTDEAYGPVKIEGAAALKITFDQKCSTEQGCDWLRLKKGEDPEQEDDFTKTRTGSGPWGDIIMEGDTVSWFFHTDQSCTQWGYRFTITAVDFPEEPMCNGILELEPEYGSDMVKVEGIACV